MLAERHAAGGVVGDQSLPASERPQPWRRGQLQGQRQLRALLRRCGRAVASPGAPDRLGRRGHPQLPQGRAPACARLGLSPPGRCPARRAGHRRRPTTPAARAPRACSADAPGEIAEACEGPVADRARLTSLPHFAARHVLDVAQAQAHASVLDHALHLGGVHVEPKHGDAPVFGLVDEAVRCVEAHRLLVQQRAQELRAVVHPQPGRLVGEQSEGGAVRLREPEAGEADDHRPHAFGAVARPDGTPVALACSSAPSMKRSR